MTIEKLVLQQKKPKQKTNQ